MMTLDEQRNWVRFKRLREAVDFVRAAGAKPGTYTFRYSERAWDTVTVPEPEEARDA